MPRIDIEGDLNAHTDEHFVVRLPAPPSGAPSVGTVLVAGTLAARS